MKRFLFGFLILLSISSQGQTGKVEDIDGNIYKTIKVGAQIWMADNLRTTRFNDGSVIPVVIGSSEWSTLMQPACCWYNNDEKTNKTLYGALYNWYAVQSGKLCPAGWHVPSDKKWLAQSPLPGGSRDEDGIFWYTPTTSFYWTSTECSLAEAYHTSVKRDGSEVKKDYAFKKYGFSVRCIKNN
jgi:hypothetical protein